MLWTTPVKPWSSTTSTLLQKWKPMNIHTLVVKRLVERSNKILKNTELLIFPLRMNLTHHFGCPDLTCKKIIMVSVLTRLLMIMQDPFSGSQDRFLAIIWCRNCSLSFIPISTTVTPCIITWTSDGSPARKIKINKLLLKQKSKKKIFMNIFCNVTWLGSCQLCSLG